MKADPVYGKGVADALGIPLSDVPKKGQSNLSRATKTYARLGYCIQLSFHAKTQFIPSTSMGEDQGVGDKRLELHSFLGIQNTAFSIPK